MQFLFDECCRGRPALRPDPALDRWEADFSADDSSITVNGTHLPTYAETELSNLPLDGVDVAIDCTGAFRTEARLARYSASGVRKVVASAPVKEGPAANIVYGVNNHVYDPAQHCIVSDASCTTNRFVFVVNLTH